MIQFTNEQKASANKSHSHLMVVHLLAHFCKCQHASCTKKNLATENMPSQKNVMAVYWTRVLGSFWEGMRCDNSASLAAREIQCV